MRWWELTKLTVIIISQYIHRSNHYTVHPKLIQTFYINYIWIKPGRDSLRNGDWASGLLFSFDLHFKASGGILLCSQGWEIPIQTIIILHSVLLLDRPESKSKHQKNYFRKLTLNIHNQFLGISQVLIRVKYSRF